MKVVVVGAHGQVAMRLHPLLVRHGHEVRGLIRSPDHADDLRRAGAEPVPCDLEAREDIADAVGPADAVVFAAGAGPGSGAARKWTVDRDGAIKLIEAARRNGIPRYVMVSAMRVEEPRGNEVFRAYLQAKAEADRALRESGLGWTIIRPGRLTDHPGRGLVSLAPELRGGEVPRDDVAAVLAEVLEVPETAGLQLDLTEGRMPVPDAVAAAVQKD